MALATVVFSWKGGKLAGPYHAEFYKSCFQRIAMVTKFILGNLVNHATKSCFWQFIEVGMAPVTCDHGGRRCTGESRNSWDGSWKNGGLKYLIGVNVKGKWLSSKTDQWYGWWHSEKDIHLGRGRGTWWTHYSPWKVPSEKASCCFPIRYRQHWPLVRIPRATTGRQLTLIFRVRFTIFLLCATRWASQTSRTSTTCSNENWGNPKFR